MRILFVHQNFPAQFRHLAPLLVAQGHEVVALAMNTPPPTPGTRIVLTQPKLGTTASHEWARDFETKVIRGEATLRTAIALKAEGFEPDVIVAHPGWGDTLFLKDVWPGARLGIYCEFFYGSHNSDFDFDPEFAPNERPEVAAARTRLRNLPQRLHFDIADAAFSPTRFQADTYPLPFRDRIDVCHDGIDTKQVRPGVASGLRFSDGRSIEPEDELVTFVSRTLEPYRGFHVFMRALPELMRRRPKAKFLIVGRETKGYGAIPADGRSWRTVMLAEMGNVIDTTRLFTLGMVDYPVFLNILRLSTLHIYLTYPFVLSWSLLEAMATECAILASDTAPVREFITDGETGRLVDFFDRDALVDHACTLLNDEHQRQRLGAAARSNVIATADLRTIALPRQIAWVEALFRATPRVTQPPV